MSERRKTVLLILILLALIGWMIYRDLAARNSLSGLQEPVTDGILVS